MRSVEGKPGGVGTINTNEVEVMIVRGVGCRGCADGNGVTTTPTDTITFAVAVLSDISHEHTLGNVP